MRRAAIFVAFAVTVLVPVGARPQGGDPRQAAQPLPPSAERAYLALVSRFNPAHAVEVVSFMDRFWRLAGNPGYSASIDHIRDGLLTGGFSAAGGSRASVRVDEFATSERGWDYRVGTVEFEEGGEPLLSRERDRVSLAINSFSTPDGGLRAPLVDLGNATDADYAGKELHGAVVLTDGPLSRVWREAVGKRGAAGVISSQVAAYIRPSGGALSAEQQDVLQWGSIPYDAAAKSFGFKASWRAADRMRQRLRQGPVVLRIHIESTFYDAPDRTLVAEIAGRSRAAERIVMVAHVQEPGANDNGSGCGTLYALARALNEAIATGVLPAPERTLTFLWVDEMRGSREWIRAYPDAATGTQYMFALDMTGEDTSRTGGTFLVEKQADPSAVWRRPSDPHTEWGSSASIPANSLKGSLLNDLHLAVCMRRARDVPWTVRANPYEGGSDHTVFANANVPSLLNWHFTDRYYHTNQDRPDKTSAGEMQNVGIAIGTSAWLLASADDSDAGAVARLVEDAARRRLVTERIQGRGIVAEAQDKAAAAATEQQVLAAWTKWYGEALDSVLRLPAGGPTDSLRQQIAAAREQIR